MAPALSRRLGQANGAPRELAFCRACRDRSGEILKATVRAQVPAGADSVKAFDLRLVDPEGKVVAEARNFAAENTLTWTGPDGKGVPAGAYTLRVTAGAPVTPSYSLEAAMYDVASPTTPGSVEQWTLTCTNGALTQTRQVRVDRGQAVDVGQLCTPAPVAAPSAGGTTGGTTAPTGQTPAPVPTAAPPAPRNLATACPEGRVPDNSHRDHEGNVHDKAIACVVWWGIANGKTATEYEPSVPVNREQMAAFVARLVERSGGQLPSEPRNVFTDDDTSPHHLAINQIASVGLVEGTGDGRYSPKAPVTRAQMAKFIVQAYQFVSGRMLPSQKDYFRDDDGNQLERFINASTQAGFTAGRDGGYQPAADVKRDAMASFLARPLDLLVAEGSTPPKR
jgi:hypothetical protein